MKQKEFYQKVTRLQFVLSIFVIYIHANNLVYYGYGIMEQNIASITTRLIAGSLSSFAVPTFMVITGYQFFRNLSLLQWKTAYKDKLKRRIRSLLIPYFLWNAFGVFFYMFITRLPIIRNYVDSAKMDINVQNIILGILVRPNVTWYLAAIFIFALLTPIIVVVLKRKWLFLILMVVLFSVSLFDGRLWVISAQNTFLYLLGAYFAIYGKELVECTYSTKWKSLSCIGILLLWLIVFCCDIHLIQVICLYIGVFLIWIASDLFSWVITPFQRQSFFIYVFHRWVLIPVDRLLILLGQMTYFWSMINYLLAPLIALGIIYAVYRLMTRFSPKFYGVITGARSNRE